MSGNELNLAGVCVEAQQAFLEAQVIRLTSLQDETSSTQKSGSVSVGTSSVSVSLSHGFSHSRVTQAATTLNATHSLYIRAHQSTHLTGVKIGVGNQGVPLTVKLPLGEQALYEYPMPEDGDSLFHALGAPRALAIQRLLQAGNDPVIRQRLGAEILDLILNSATRPACLQTPRLSQLLEDYHRALDKTEALQALQAYAESPEMFRAYTVGHLAQPTTLIGPSPSLYLMAELQGISLRIVEGEADALMVTYESRGQGEVLTLRYFAKAGNFTLLAEERGLFISPVLTYQDLEDMEKSKHTHVGVGVGFASGPEGGASKLGIPTLDAGHKRQDKRELQRATVSDNIAIKTQSAVSNLNRDLSKAKEMTRNSKTHIRIFAPIMGVKSLKEMYQDIPRQFARIPAYFKPDTVERYHAEALQKEMNAYERQGLDSKEIHENLQDEAVLAKIAQKGSEAFLENYFTRRGQELPDFAKEGLSQGLTPQFKPGAEGETLLVFMEPQYISVTQDADGQPKLVVQMGRSPKPQPAPTAAPKALAENAQAQDAVQDEKGTNLKKEAQSSDFEKTRDLAKKKAFLIERQKILVQEMKAIFRSQGIGSVSDVLLNKIAEQQLSRFQSYEAVEAEAIEAYNLDPEFRRYATMRLHPMNQGGQNEEGFQPAVAALGIQWLVGLSLSALAFFGCKTYQDSQDLGYKGYMPTPDAEEEPRIRKNNGILWMFQRGTQEGQDASDESVDPRIREDLGVLWMFRKKKADDQKGKEKESPKAKETGQVDLPGTGKNWLKLRGNQGWKNLKDGTIWTKDKLHKDHWDIKNEKDDKIREIDFHGNQIWPGGPKNKNKVPNTR